MGWIKCEDRMPEEHPSVFSKLKKQSKCLYMSNSKDVLVTYEFEDGARTVDVANTHDGKWHSDTIRFFEAGKKSVKVVSWMPFPDPDKN